jgi:hypothetical protein
LLVVTTYRQNSLTDFYHKKEVNLIERRSMTPGLKTAMIETMKLVLGNIQLRITPLRIVARRCSHATKQKQKP